MTNTTTSRNLFPTLVCSTLLVAFASASGVTHAADGRSSSSANRSSGQSGTTITRELEKLFNESGQEMPSMRTQDLPYATTPQMNRVRRIDATAPKKKKKVSLFGKLFGRFRRDRRIEEEVAPQPPPIVMNDSTRPRNNSNQNVMRPRVVPSATVAQSRTSVPQQQRRSTAAVRQNPSTHMVRQKSRGTSGKKTTPPTSRVAELPRLDLPEEEVIEVAQQKSAAMEDEFLDLDAVAEIPDVAPLHPASEPEIVVEEVVESEPQAEASPFTGVQLAESDEFVNPFEEVTEEAEPADPLVDRESNPFMVSEAESANEQNSHSISAVSSSKETSGANASASFDDFVAADEGLEPEEAPKEPTREELIESRKSKSGFLGFCPVALCDRQELVDSEDDHKARFGLKTYHFSSAEAVQTFRKNPTHYAPVAAGADVVALVNAGEELAGSIRYAMWYQDRLYLFHSQETKDLFCDAPADFANQY